MTRHRRYDSWHEWERNVRWFVIKGGDGVSPPEQRRALLRMAAYMAVVWCACAGLFFVWSLRHSPAFDDRSPDGWVKGITTGRSAERAAALSALAESRMLSRVSCRVLGDRLQDSAAVREAAVLALIHSVRAGRCEGIVLGTLTGAPAWQSREAALHILAGAGTAARGFAVTPLLHALRTDSATRGAAVGALGAIGDTSERVRNALEGVFHTSRGELRATALEVLVELKTPTRRLRPLD